MKKRFSIKDFRLATPVEISRNADGHGILGGSPRGLSTFVVYSFLKEHFGRPNSPLPEMLVEKDRVTWEYVLKSPRARHLLAVYDWKLHRWAIGIRFPLLRDYHKIG